MPNAALKPCPKHPSILLKPNQKCSKCPNHKWGNRKIENTTERGYGYKWQKLRKIVLSRDNYLCQICLDNYKITPANEVDHIIPKFKGGNDDLGNLQSICSEHHKQKSSTEGNIKY